MIATTESPSLTDRELQIARLVATDLTNQAIARRLGISPRIVQSHLRSAYSKIGAANRAGLCRWLWAET
jgi:DNA-binding CsgD family transcriptional regulator